MKGECKRRKGVREGVDEGSKRREGGLKRREGRGSVQRRGRGRNVWEMETSMKRR